MSPKSRPDPGPNASGEFTFCPYCAAELEIRPDGEGQSRRVCPQCQWIHYRNPTVGVAAIVLTADGLLLGRRQSGGWCIPCGHVEWHESIHQAVVREMREELGVEIQVGPLYNAHSNFHNPAQHTVGLWFEVALPQSVELIPGGDLVELRVFPLDQIPDLIFPTDGLIVEQLCSDSRQRT